eukprot:364868-Chlamydomonas_euryale.AAC.1
MQRTRPAPPTVCCQSPGCGSKAVPHRCSAPARATRTSGPQPAPSPRARAQTRPRAAARGKPARTRGSRPAATATARPQQSGRQMRSRPCRSARGHHPGPRCRCCHRLRTAGAPLAVAPSAVAQRARSTRHTVRPAMRTRSHRAIGRRY